MLVNALKIDQHSGTVKEALDLGAAAIGLIRKVHAVTWKVKGL